MPISDSSPRLVYSWVRWSDSKQYYHLKKKKHKTIYFKRIIKLREEARRTQTAPIFPWSMFPLALLPLWPRISITILYLRSSCRRDARLPSTCPSTPRAPSYVTTAQHPSREPNTLQHCLPGLTLHSDFASRREGSRVGQREKSDIEF